MPPDIPQSVLRPLLVCRTIEQAVFNPVADSLTRVAARPAPLGSRGRLVIRAPDHESVGMAIVLQLARASRGRRQPISVVAIEVSVPNHRHWAVMFALSALCDPSPSARSALSNLRRCSPVHADVDAAWARGLSERITTCASERVARALLEVAMSIPSPRTDLAELRADLVRRSLALADTSAPTAALDLAGELVRARTSARAGGMTPRLPLEAYRSVCRRARRSYWARVLRSLIAEQAARQATALENPDNVRLRSILRAERFARSAGHAVRAALIRSYRRKVLQELRADTAATALVLMIRPLVVAGETATPWLITNAVIYLRLRGGECPAGRVRSALCAWTNAGSPYPIEPHLRLAARPQVLGLGPHLNLPLTGYRTVARHCALNQFSRATRALTPEDRKGAELIHWSSLGLVQVASLVTGQSAHFFLPASTTALVRGTETWTLEALTGESALGAQPIGATDRLCAHSLLGDRISPDMLSFLVRRLDDETTWARRVIVAMSASIAALRLGHVAWAGRIILRGRRAYDALRRLEKARKAKGPRPQTLVRYEDQCRAVLRSFSPPLRAGKSPVLALAAAVRQLPPRRRRSRLRTTIAALDALVAVGGGRHAEGLHDRVVREMARMVGARVLLHYECGRYRVLAPQREHTLSTWTIRGLARPGSVATRRVRRRPEFWRPEQRRPRAVLRFPLGDGVVCLMRRRAFRPSEVEAVRVVLGFLRQRIETPGRPLISATAVHHGMVLDEPGNRVSLLGIVGDSPAWRLVLNDVWRAARGDVPVLLTGATGTGKEVVARAIHLTSGRAQFPFVAVSCATLRGDTLLSELFGHVKGAFSGATSSHRGIYEVAHRGTLFLDEIGEASPELQAALLRVLQDGVIRPVGGTSARTVNVRTIAATNRDLEVARRTGRFREDLFHRLTTVRIELPPLRERLTDIPLLAEHFIAKHAPERSLHPDAFGALSSYEWPGNARELESVLRAAALQSDSREISASTIRPILDGRRGSRQRQMPWPHLAPRAAAVLDAMRGGWWTASDLAERLGAAHRTLNRDLAMLVAQGHVERTGEARSRRYRRVSAAGLEF